MFFFFVFFLFNLCVTFDCHWKRSFWIFNERLARIQIVGFHVHYHPHETLSGFFVPVTRFVKICGSRNKKETIIKHAGRANHRASRLPNMHIMLYLCSGHFHATVGCSFMSSYLMCFPSIPKKRPLGNTTCKLFCNAVRFRVVFLVVSERAIRRPRPVIYSLRTVKISQYRTGKETLSTDPERFQWVL